MATSGTSPLTRYALLPARSVTDRPYTTLLPYRLRGELVIIGARPVQPAQPGPDLSELRRRDRAELEFELVAGRPAGPPWPVARLSLERRLGVEETERLAFDPTNTGGGLELAGLVNRLRGPSYRGSQAGRGIHLEERIDSMSEEERKTKAR